MPLWLLGIGRFLKRIPWQVWLALAIAFAIWRGMDWHANRVRRMLHHADAVGYQRAKTEDIEAGRKLKDQVRALGDSLAAETRKRTDEENRRSARLADDLRLRGPGKAICRLDPAIPARAGRSEPASGGGAVAAGGLPDQDRIAVPFDWFVDQAEVADANRTEVIGWRSWYAKTAAAWAKLTEPTK